MSKSSPTRTITKKRVKRTKRKLTLTKKKTTSIRKKRVLKKKKTRVKKKTKVKVVKKRVTKNKKAKKRVTKKKKVSTKRKVSRPKKNSSKTVRTNNFYDHDWYLSFGDMLTNLVCFISTLGVSTICWKIPAKQRILQRMVKRTW